MTPFNGHKNRKSKPEYVTYPGPPHFYGEFFTWGFVTPYMGFKMSKKAKLLKDSDVEQWYRNISRGSPIKAEVDSGD